MTCSQNTTPANPAQGVTSLTISSLQRAHIERQEEWCPEQKPDLSFRGNEMAGEVGEACNVIKKLERERQGWRGSRATKEQLAEELADVVHTAVLCAITAGIDLEPAVFDKFNSTSEKNGLMSRLTAAIGAGGQAVAQFLPTEDGEFNGNDVGERHLSSTTAYDRDQLAKLAFAIFYSANLCAPQNIAAVIREIDTCSDDCDGLRGSVCNKAERGDYCPFSLAEDLRQLSAALFGPNDPSHYVARVFGPDAMSALSNPPAQTGWRKPRLTESMMRAACKAHFGDENIDGVCITVKDRDWTFREAFKRMWRGALSAAPQPKGEA